MNKVELTSAKLAKLRQKAEAAETQGQSPWMFVKIEEEYHTYCEVRDMYGCQVIEDSTQEEAEHIAEADPATVLAMVEEIERLRSGLKASCPHWQQDGDGINEWRRCCTNSSYTIPEGGEPSEFCPDCGGKVEVLDYNPNAESEAGQ